MTSPYSICLSVARCSVLLLALVALAGCATPPEHAAERTPPVHVSEATWRQVDRDIAAEALAASGAAKNLARQQMERWRQLVEQRSETEFIPWLSSYLTQQWLTAKVAMYKLDNEKGADSPENRLAAYLQKQYYARVLAPVAKEVDPAAVIEKASNFYVQHLARQLPAILRRYDIPPDQFEQRLQGIPAIALGPPPSHDASLYLLVHTVPIDSLPAYAALLRHVREAGADAGAGLSKTRISPMAKRVSEKMLDRLAVSGGTSAAAALIGGAAGTVFALGATGLGMILHEGEREEIEQQVRPILQAAMDDIWHTLMEDPDAGVTAGINYLSQQIDNSLSPGFKSPDEPEKRLDEPDGLPALLFEDAS